MKLVAGGFVGHRLLGKEEKLQNGDIYRMVYRGVDDGVDWLRRYDGYSKAGDYPHLRIYRREVNTSSAAGHEGIGGSRMASKGRHVQVA